MPQPVFLLGNQRGSVLAGVLGLSLVLTLSAAGYVTLVANAGGDEVFTQEEAAAYYAAESGFLLGVRYVTRNDSLDLSTMSLGTSHTVLDWTVLDGFSTLILLTSVTPPNQFRVESWATLGEGHDTTIIRGETRITQKIRVDSCVVALKGWQDTVRVRN